MHRLFQVFDLVAQTVTGPIMAVNREAPAIREFHALLATGDKTTVGSSPKDFILLEIGLQDQETGMITGHADPFPVAKGAEWQENQRRGALGLDQSDR